MGKTVLAKGEGRGGGSPSSQTTLCAVATALSEHYTFSLGFSTDMDTVQHTSKDINTAYRGFTMPTRRRDGTRRGMAVREQSHDRKKEMAFFLKTSHMTEKNEKHLEDDNM